MAFLQKFNDIVWGPPLIILVILVGILLTVRLRLVQIFKLPLALKFMVKNEDDGEGEVSSFGALCTALAATVGTGNIVGVATAIGIGGPGALFWMWIAAFFGMATKYAEGVLAVRFRKIDQDGHVLGGPFYYIENGLGKGYKWLAKLFAAFGSLAAILGIGTMVQVNGITSSVQAFLGSDISAKMLTIGSFSYPWVVVITAVIVTFSAGLVIIGGLKRISDVSEFLVPFMAVFYVVGCLIVVALNINNLPSAIALVIKSAFTGTAATGGFVGATFMLAMQKGVARGIFSNESGLGSAPIAAAAAKTNWPARQGLVSMTGTFIDTIVICTMTGLCLIMTNSWNIGLQGAEMTNYAFQTGFTFMPMLGKGVVTLGLALFAFTTILGWNYYGERCLEYLTGGSLLKSYRWLYIIAVFIGPFLTLDIVWTIADICNGMMAFPNLIALLLLSGVVVEETKRFNNHLKLSKH